jgi:hypothetical protein
VGCEMKKRRLCRLCEGNGSIKIPGGVSICRRCGGDCYEPDSGSLQGWVLDNIYTIARREIKRGDERGTWGHVLRLCEKVGCQGRGVLRDNGGSVGEAQDVTK